MDEEQIEVLNSLFASAFTDTSFHTSQVDGTQGSICGSKVTPAAREGLVWDHLRDLNILESMGPDEVQARVFRELAKVIAKPLSVVFEKSWQSGDVLGVWKNANMEPIFKKGERSYQPVSITSLSGMMIKHHPRSCATTHGQQ